MKAISGRRLVRILKSKGWVVDREPLRFVLRKPKGDRPGVSGARTSGGRSWAAPRHQRPEWRAAGHWRGCERAVCRQSEFPAGGGWGETPTAPPCGIRCKIQGGTGATAGAPSPDRRHRVVGGQRAFRGRSTLDRTRVPSLRHVRDTAAQDHAHASCTDTCTAASHPGRASKSAPSRSASSAALFVQGPPRRLIGHAGLEASRRAPSRHLNSSQAMSVVRCTVLLILTSRANILTFQDVRCEYSGGKYSIYTAD